jgi:hypothetical protein
MPQVSREKYYGSWLLFLVMLSVGIGLTGYGVTVMVQESETASFLINEYTEEVNGEMVEGMHQVFRDNGYQVVSEDIQYGTPMTVYAEIYLGGTVPSGYLEMLNESGSTTIYTGIITAKRCRYWWFNGETGVKIAIAFKFVQHYPPGYDEHELSPAVFISIGGCIILLTSVFYYWVVQSEIKPKKKKKKEKSDFSKADRVLEKLKK